MDSDYRVVRILGMGELMGRPARELTPHASLRHFLGAELRHWRQAAELSHARLGERVNYSGALIAKVEKAERTPAPALAQACDRVLGTGGVLSRLVELIEAAEQEEAAPVAAQWPGDVWLLAGHRPTVGGESARGAGPVNRFEFLVSALGASAGSLVGSDSAEATRLGAEDVASWQRRVSRLYELEAEYGGGVVYELAYRSLWRLRRALQRNSYTTSTGDALHTIVGELTKHAGWLAFDAGLQAEARYWWLEASHTARLVDDDHLLVGVLRLLSQQAGDLDRASEAIDSAQAAQRAAKSWGTPRLRSNLLVREAIGHARAGDKKATLQVFHQAEALFGAGPHDDDPPWLYFWNEADFACCEMRAALSMGELPVAERRIRTALGAVRPEHARNRTSYLTHQAAVLVEQRSIEEAISTAAQAVEGASELSSARIDARIGRVRAELSRYSDQLKVAEFLDWSGQIMKTKVNGLLI
ncbi:MAG: helix-turn-helix domain-containing protein [Pseudonocardiaceae bacterium]